MDPNQLKNRIRVLAKQVYSNRRITPQEAVQYDELTKFPELKQILMDLLTIFWLVLKYIVILIIM